MNAPSSWTGTERFAGRGISAAIKKEALERKV